MPPRAHLMASEKAELDKQLEVAEQLLNPDPAKTLQQITHSLQKGVTDSLQELSEQSDKPEAEYSSDTEPFKELRNLFHTPSEPEMTTPAASASAAPEVKIEHADEEWATTIATSVIDVIKKDDNTKTPLSKPYEGDHKDTQQFLLDVELYFVMNSSKYNTDEKKKMFLLSLLKGRPKEWKMGEQLRLFPEDDDPAIKKKAAKETWDSFKKRFRTTWQPVDIKGDAQMKLEDL
ncbi:hypothetical protein Moror_9324 [Moniliophthora roreri MCA 2997]|uniref:DUF4939 domain-containing protein n=2 Tax=Moniliophthora roreri TaxID=221103 RepID=V2WX50_MONRO|nr:hypothetical protein Moror_9324 [Moniliophthora roreri MCA 2997]KAI3605415.1 hypothetical protein WG66_006003 [Moniliophthora roreri]